MTNTTRTLLQAVGLAMFLGVTLGALANGNPFGAVTYILACIGFVLWLAMTYAVHPKAAS